MDQYNQPLPPAAYAYGPAYGGGYLPGVPAIANYPVGLNAGDASIKIGDITNTIGANWGTGTQTLGGALPYTTTTLPGGTQTPLPVVLTPAPVAPMPMYVPPRIEATPEPQRSAWPMLLAAVCLLIALGIGGYFLYKRFVGGSSNSNKKNNAGSKKSSANAPAKTPANNDFSEFDFGDDITPPTTTK